MAAENRTHAGNSVKRGRICVRWREGGREKESEKATREVVAFVRGRLAVAPLPEQRGVKMDTGSDPERVIFATNKKKVARKSVD